MQAGKSSIKMEKGPVITSFGTVAGPKEGDGPLRNGIDKIETDSMLSKKNWEEAESQLQKEALGLAIQKGNLEIGSIRYLFAGDLLGQLIATSFGIADFNIPLFGLYGACSTMGESLMLAAMTVHAGYADRAAALASSHFASAEKQFRFPLGYGNQRPFSATWTVTGSGAVIVAKEGLFDKDGEASVSYARVAGVTPGRVVDIGCKDSMNMGAAMAPAAFDTIVRHFQDFDCGPEEYDKIITGDLGIIGQRILLDMLKQKGYPAEGKHMDCGLEIYARQTQDVHSGGSGCGCAAVTLGAYILPKLFAGNLRKVLFVPTGALLSTVSFNEGQSVPGIAHAVVLEHC
ncbi:MAG: stage V sporulation protein AD [bacterium]|nr:stage V sporulation protein AD [bacterium]